MKNQKLKNLIEAKASLLQKPSEVTILNNNELMMTLGGFSLPCGSDSCGSDSCDTNGCNTKSCRTNSCGTQSCSSKDCGSNV